MKIPLGNLSQSEFVTIDEKGWHISDEAPEDLKKEFDNYFKVIGSSVEEILD